MARVYLAEFESGMNFKRKVALKVVRPEFAKDDKFIQLMAREALIGSWLQHPNIVETLEFNQCEGRHYLALEFVEGDTLEGLLQDASNRDQMGLQPALALEVMIQVLKGLSYAHQLRSPEGEALQIVHRDLKPGNLMLSKHGLVKIMDFGIAKAKVAVAMLTAAGQVRGTPIYMAPEQVLGRDLDGRSDQFAAATVMHELITGRQVFLAGNLVQIMTRVARVDVGDAVDEVEALIPGVGPILARMWSKVPEDRFTECAEVASLLEDLLLPIKKRDREASRSATAVAPALKKPAAPAPPAANRPAQLVPSAKTPSPPPVSDVRVKAVEKEAPPKEKSSGFFRGLLGFGKKEPEPPKKQDKPREKRPVLDTAPGQRKVAGPVPAEPAEGPGPTAMVPRQKVPAPPPAPPPSAPPAPAPSAAVHAATQVSSANLRSPGAEQEPPVSMHQATAVEHRIGHLRVSDESPVEDVLDGDPPAHSLPTARLEANAAVGAASRGDVAYEETFAMPKQPPRAPVKDPEPPPPAVAAPAPPSLAAAPSPLATDAAPEAAGQPIGVTRVMKVDRSQLPPIAGLTKGAKIGPTSGQTRKPKGLSMFQANKPVAGLKGGASEDDVEEVDRTDDDFFSGDED